MSVARDRLRQAGLSSVESDLSARLLAQHVLGWSTEQFLIDARGAEPDGFAHRYDALIARRAAREPLAYITGVREFWGLSFEVTRDVLIPRPETELIVEAALEVLDAAHPVAVGDICTGSGCLAIAIASARPLAAVLASDISESALAVARRNAERHGVADRIHFEHADLLRGIDSQFDLIVANPPYVRELDVRGLQPEVRNEPAVALFAGPDGLDAVARLVDEAAHCMRPGSYLIFEFGLGQEIEVEDLIERAPGLSLVELRRDLLGIARAAVVRRI
jgi:release factor glutamine methyltransferase